ncbi:hypothetical protein HUU05_04030 [candidate division KSB1 bacterium]|nr:hypothetical protein [candidate division KSB1 bacterium]
MCRLLCFLPAFITVFLTACSSDEFKPEELPFRLESFASYEPSVILDDLDNDGRYEIIKPYNDTDVKTGTRSSFLQIRSHDDLIIEQINFPAIIWSVAFIDLERDGAQEVVVTLMRKDSLFVSFLNLRGAKLFSFFLVNGYPRREPEGELEWDPAITDFHLADANGDGIDELVTVIRTGLARAPRGILIHTLPEGKLLDQKLVGAMIMDSYCDDFDGDGVSELFVWSFAPNNGAQVGGFDDAHSYLIAFELGIPIEVVWSKQYGSAWSLAKLNFADFDGDGKREFIVSSSTIAANQPLKSSFEFIEPETWRCYRQIEMPDYLREHLVADLNRDGKPEIITLHHPDEVWLLNQDFKVIKSTKLFANGVSMSLSGDLDGDSFTEIAVSGAQNVFVLGPDLEVKAMMEETKFLGRMRRSLAEPYCLRVEHKGRTELMRMVKNDLYLLNRYGTRALWLLGSCLVFALVIAAARIRRRFYLMKSSKLQTEQTQAWSLMAERVAHDLKSPLTSILLTLQRLQKEYRKHSPQHAQAYDEYAANIIERIEASRRLTRNFLKLIDIEKLHLVETEVNRFLQQTTDALNLPPDTQCELKPSAEPFSVPMDHEQMQVALENLVANAINAMPEGGKITLAVSLARNLHLPNANGNSSDYAVIEVQDTGIGIPAAAREHLFEPKFTTSENGTGLGLAMVKKIVDAHHGHIEFESEEGMGTVFSVYLPVV